jgi:YafQ family addiction module toxin component
MTYALEITPTCKESIDKACRKNPVLRKALTNKMNEILGNPGHYKPLRGQLSGEYRVHILKSFVLTYEIIHDRNAVSFIKFDHHDRIYTKRR